MKSLSENELNMVAGGGLYEGELESYTVLPGEDLKVLFADSGGTCIFHAVRRRER